MKALEKDAPAVVVLHTIRRMGVWLVQGWRYVFRFICCKIKLQNLCKHSKIFAFTEKGLYSLFEAHFSFTFVEKDDKSSWHLNLI